MNERMVKKCLLFGGNPVQTLGELNGSLKKVAEGKNIEEIEEWIDKGWD